ncbi:site-specific integrase [Henriciella sp.]|uniref:tyrosine-type recombinase/integrase n=1 Tax=Henriciella sp. TaxID=1968823 RepID=UPI002611D323|nr:site-specific integrase [Henriciella sp.]
MESQQIASRTAESSDTGLTRRSTVRITDRLVRSLEPPAYGNRVLFDDRLTGFGVRITAKGSIAFVLNYSFKGRERRITIGKHPTFTVLAARKQCEQFKLEVAQGIDPLERKQADHRAPTVEDMWIRYEKEYLPKLAERSGKDQKSMFEKLILPALGKKKVSDVTFNDCEALHRKITKDRPTRANRVIEVLRRNFNLAIKWGWVKGNPAAGIERNVESMRERYLTASEITRLITALDRHPQRSSAEAIKFMLFTGCRRGEALNAQWDQFDDSLKVWTKPAATTKQRKLHRTPISSSASQILRARKKTATTNYVFPGGTGKSLTDVKKTWAAVTKAAELFDVRLHDLRHTFASVAVSKGQSLPIIGALLGHSQTQTTARYAHLVDSALFDAVSQIDFALGQPVDID